MSSVVFDPQALDLRLPWVVDLEQEEKFKRNLRRFLIPLLLLLLIIPFLPTLDKEYVEPDSDAKKTKIILEPVVIETPEPVVEKPKPTPKPKPKPKQTPPPEPPKKAEPKSDVPPKAPKPTEKKKDVAEAAGLQGLSDQLGALRNMNLKTLQNKNVSTSNAGQVRKATKSTLGENINQRSEGVDLENMEMSDESIQLAMHKSTKLDGFVGGGGGSPDGSDSSKYYSAIQGQRSDESIRRTMEAGKGKAYLFYQRELRRDPGLAGTFVFELVIQPDGSVSSLKLVSSELNNSDLDQRILEVVRQFNFGAKDVSPRTLTYKFNFIPS
ncbi:hypothetical protein TDB9533_04192 [Thalassocella blandensis]|nr:hypothetical protein TDB9533_04192 [Thalassocella blandensis]